MAIDRLLPDIDGIHIIRQLRDEGICTPALIISALGEIDDRVRGLRAGGDDYLVKPFAFAELWARLRALARRNAAPPPRKLSFADVALDRGTLRATRGRRVLDLTPTERALLEQLLLADGAVVARDALLRAVWGYDFDPGTNLVDVHVGRLRKKLDGAGDSPLLRAVRGVGYRLGDA